MRCRAIRRRWSAASPSGEDAEGDADGGRSKCDRVRRRAQMVRLVPRAARRQSHRRARRAHRRVRPVGLGQVDADPLRQPARGASARRHPRRRRRTDERFAAHRRSAPRSRHGVPAVQPVPASDDPGELHAGADLGAQDAQARGGGTGDEAARRGSRFPSRRTNIPASSRAASSSASPSPEPCA